VIGQNDVNIIVVHGDIVTRWLLLNKRR